MLIIDSAIKKLLKTRRRKSLASHPSSKWIKYCDRHSKAILEASTVFLDTAVYFSLSISFASILFNYRNTPILYEDKLGQTSSLLAVNTPLTLLLLTYNRLDKRMLRYVLAGAAALLTFIIQFMFRRARSFPARSNVCFNWQEDMEASFDELFIFKAIWGLLVLFFFASHLITWGLPRFFSGKRCSPLSKLRGWFTADSSNKGKSQNYRVLSKSSQITNKSNLFLVKRVLSFIYVHLQQLFAVLLSAYGIFDSFFDIRFIQYLREQEKILAYASQEQDDEDIWGYGQIFAVLIWLPIVVEYLYDVWTGEDSENETESEDEHQDNLDFERQHQRFKSPCYSPPPERVQTFPQSHRPSASIPLLTAYQHSSSSSSVALVDNSRRASRFEEIGLLEHG